MEGSRRVNMDLTLEHLPVSPVATDLAAAAGVSSCVGLSTYGRSGDHIQSASPFSHSHGHPEHREGEVYKHKP